MMPQGRAGHDFDNPFAPSIPAVHLDASPTGLRIGQAFGQAGLTRSDDPSADSDDPGQRFRLKPDADSDPRRTVIPMIPSKVVVDVFMGSGSRLGVKHDRLCSPFSQ